MVGIMLSVVLVWSSWLSYQENPTTLILTKSVDRMCVVPAITLCPKTPYKEDVVKELLLKTTVKETSNLPSETPDNMLYSPKKYKGLGLYKASWEAFLQFVNVCKLLAKTNNIYVSNTRDFTNEIQASLDKLGLANIDSSDQINVSSLRTLLRDKEFDSWCTLPQKGKGVILYKEYTPGNKWLSKPNGLTSSEWKGATKMTANVCPVRALPGRSQNGTHCRHCQSEKETLAHILGACPHGELLWNSRHHKIRSLLASALRGKKLPSRGGGPWFDHKWMYKAH
ncbi:hypothetical protein ANN_08696 [Periplaneta americana]|uniref:Uncharacterized protein n=1 Tax=Periplaneta americana TaxID=6978 RepID=A0ABQ8T3I7_PERAM|nr:hypothetical protein ANN_08696 [Periplaneta americana]